MDRTETVFLVEDEPTMRQLITHVITQAGYSVRAFADPQLFLDDESVASVGGCVILDQRLPNMLGSAVQEEMHRRGMMLPVIFLSAANNLSAAVRALRNGAVDWIEKPVDWTMLLDCVKRALAKDALRVANAVQAALVQQKLRDLSVREREVMLYLADGRANKWIGITLGISQRTVEAHRARVMSKMNVDSAARLVAELNKVAA